MKRMLIGILVGAALAAAALFFAFGSTPVSVQEGETTYTTDIIANKIAELSELASLEYAYKNAASLDKESSTVKLFNTNIDIPFSAKKLIFTYEGTVKMGPDLSQADVAMDGNKVMVTIPHSHIISHELDENSFEYLVEKSGLFNPLTQEDGVRLRQQQKDVVEASIEEKGLLDEADEKARAQIESFLTALESDFEVTVTVG